MHAGCMQPWGDGQAMLPSLLGMLVAGVILANLPGKPMESMDKQWALVIKYGAVAIIFLRSGLEQDVQVRR